MILIMNQKLYLKSLEEGNKYSSDSESEVLNVRKHKYLNKKKYRNNNPDDSDEENLISRKKKLNSNNNKRFKIFKY